MGRILGWADPIARSRRALFSVATAIGVVIPPRLLREHSVMDEVREEHDRVSALERSKRRLLIWLAVTVSGNALFDQAIGLPVRDFDFALFATSGLAALFAFAWVRLDAKQRGVDLKAWGAFVAILTKFALPAYLVVSRGWRNGLIACFRTLLLLASLLLIYWITIELSLRTLALFPKPS